MVWKKMCQFSHLAALVVVSLTFVTKASEVKRIKRLMTHAVAATWTQASRSCHDRGQRLAIVDFYTRLSLRHAALEADMENKPFWIGVFKEESVPDTPEDGEMFRWIDCTPVPEWAQDDIHNAHGTGSCVALQDSFFRWVLRECAGQIGFVCESLVPLTQESRPSCSYSTQTLNCIWMDDATFSHHPDVSQSCEDECDRQPRCWGFIPARFTVSHATGSFHHNEGTTGCTLVQADKLRMCKPTTGSYTMSIKLCYEYENVTSGLDLPLNLPTIPASQSCSMTDSGKPAADLTTDTEHIGKTTVTSELITTPTVATKPVGVNPNVSPKPDAESTTQTIQSPKDHVTQENVAEDLTTLQRIYKTKPTTISTTNVKLQPLHSEFEPTTPLSSPIDSRTSLTSVADSDTPMTSTVGPEASSASDTKTTISLASDVDSNTNLSISEADHTISSTSAVTVTFRKSSTSADNQNNAPTFEISPNNSPVFETDSNSPSASEVNPINRQISEINSNDPPTPKINPNNPPTPSEIHGPGNWPPPIMHPENSPISDVELNTPLMSERDPSISPTHEAKPSNPSTSGIDLNIPMTSEIDLDSPSTLSENVGQNALPFSKADPDKVSPSDLDTHTTFQRDDSTPFTSEGSAKPSPAPETDLDVQTASVFATDQSATELFETDTSIRFRQEANQHTSQKPAEDADTESMLATDQSGPAVPLVDWDTSSGSNTKLNHPPIRHDGTVADTTLPSAFQALAGSSSRTVESVRPTSKHQCPCRCQMTLSQKQIQQNISDTVKSLQHSLRVTVSNLSSTQRRKLSAQDSRPSAQYTGTISICILTALGLAILLPDLRTAIRGITGSWSRRRFRSSV